MFFGSPSKLSGSLRLASSVESPKGKMGYFRASVFDSDDLIENTVGTEK